ncbi:TRAP transporter small permease subunit [sulfur-oxidizing endosymbiont of Gigantopelta aegis]|uniref:TRAP transporter small permease subunit n=1 Tax=sulfur-oxidizing endosymbiont of Gigantopelta aegis TaxID=2794934 RepID=UPI0031B5B0A9
MKQHSNQSTQAMEKQPFAIRIAAHLQRITVFAGQSIAWLTLLMVLTTFAIVVLRYGFEMGWIAMQESVIYMYALVFLIGIPYTLKEDGHVRVDIFYCHMKPRRKAWVNLLGAVFLLLPVTLFIAWISWDYVAASWSMKEQSGEAGACRGFIYSKPLFY